MAQNNMSFKEADTLYYYLNGFNGILSVKIYERTADAAIVYSCTRKEIIEALRRFKYEAAALPEGIAENSGREINAYYKEKLILKIGMRMFMKCFIPYPVRVINTAVKSIRYIGNGIKCLLRKKLEVPVLDAVAIGVSIARRDFATAGSVMFMLGIGELLEEWTHKKSVGDLARSMSLNLNKVWVKHGEQEILANTDDVECGDEVVVRMGGVIPFDGIVTEGEAMVNQASMTGEPLPVKKGRDGYVYAGTVIEEGELVIKIKEVSGSTRFEKIIKMIEETEKLKSSVESKAEHLADRLVPYTFLGTAAVWAVTRNVTKALSVLMVDFSCALKLAMPITVLSAIREANSRSITIKGGKYIEAVAAADTIVFDKTGTLTKARPEVKEVISFGEGSPEEMLRVAACLEEHFPHPMAKAVVREAKRRRLEHEEMHSKVDYIVAHGIASYIGDKRVIIGSYHFVFEDENCTVRQGYEKLFDELPTEYSHLYLAVDSVLAAVICIEDPVREEAASVIKELKGEGLKIVMMTGDSERTAAAIADKIGVDEYYSEALPDEKAEFVKKERERGNGVIMVGDGINDSPALSAANAGVAISEGAELAREIADITISAESLWELVALRRLSALMMKRIGMNYKTILAVNGSLILLGVGGVIQPTASALFHNASTLGICLKSMNNLMQ